MQLSDHLILSIHGAFDSTPEIVPAIARVILFVLLKAVRKEQLLWCLRSILLPCVAQGLLADYVIKAVRRRLIFPTHLDWPGKEDVTCGAPKGWLRWGGHLWRSSAELSSLILMVAFAVRFLNRYWFSLVVRLRVELVTIKAVMAHRHCWLDKFAYTRKLLHGVLAIARSELR